MPMNDKITLTLSRKQAEIIFDGLYYEADVCNDRMLEFIGSTDTDDIITARECSEAISGYLMVMEKIFIELNKEGEKE